MWEQFDQALRLASTRIVESVANFLPGALVFFVLIVVALFVAVAARYVLRRALTSLDFDRRSELLGISLADWTPSRSASALVASVAFWTVLGLGLLLGLTALDAALPSQFAVSVLEYVPHVVAAVAIMVGGGITARFLARAILIGAVNMGLQSARLMSLGVKWLVLVVAAAMALDHIGIGRTVMLLAFSIVLGGVVLAMALAVGLGARDAVSRALERQFREPARDDRLDHV
jgi:hypothetical protein